MGHPEDSSSNSDIVKFGFGACFFNRSTEDEPGKRKNKSKELAGNNCMLQ